MILAIDPGPERSGWVLYRPEDDIPVSSSGTDDNGLIAAKSSSWAVVACEWIDSYGMAVGRDVFETCYWVGRFAATAGMCGGDFHRITRREIKLYLCNTARATDANVRQALIDRFGGSKAKAIGTKKSPGPLYNVKGHAWAALAVAVTWAGRGQ